jgi:tetratricopeptide (TPR) repeat protein
VLAPQNQPVEEEDTVDTLEKRFVFLLDDNFARQEQELCQLLSKVVAKCGELHPLTIKCLVKLGEVEKKLGMYASCAARYRKATHSLAQLALLDTPTELDANLPIALAFGIAEVERKLNHWNEAEVGYHHTLRLLEDWTLRSFDPKHPNAWVLVHCHRGNGLIFKKRGVYAKAKEEYDVARTILKDGNDRKYGLDLPANAIADARWKQALAVVLTDQCDWYRKRADYANALESVDLAIERLAEAKATLGVTKTASDEGDARYAKGLVLVEQTIRPADALPEVELASLCYAAAGFAPNHLKFGLLEAITGCAKFLVATQKHQSLSADFEAAQTHLTKAINLLGQSLAANDLEIADCRLKWIECFVHLLQIGRASSTDKTLALEHLDQAEAIYTQSTALAGGMTSHHSKLETCAFVRQLLEPDNMWLD